MRKLAIVAAALGLFCLFLGVLAGSIWDYATDDAIYLELQSETGILESSGFSESEVKALDENLTGYLAGTRDSLTQGFYTDDEIAHMADVRALCDLAANVADLSVPVCLLLIAVSALLLWKVQPPRHLWRAAFWAHLFALFPFLLFAAKALINFDGAFTLFHKLLFRNDLWLLPGNSTLIRLLPESFFAKIGMRIAVTALWRIRYLPAVCLIAAGYGYIKRRQSADDANSGN